MRALPCSAALLLATTVMVLSRSEKGMVWQHTDTN